MGEGVVERVDAREIALVPSSLLAAQTMARFDTEITSHHGDRRVEDAQMRQAEAQAEGSRAPRACPPSSGVRTRPGASSIAASARSSWRGERISGGWGPGGRPPRTGHADRLGIGLQRLAGRIRDEMQVEIDVGRTPARLSAAAETFSLIAPLLWTSLCAILCTARIAQVRPAAHSVTRGRGTIAGRVM